MKVNLVEAKHKLSALVDRAIEGQPTVILRRGKPAAKLIPFKKPAQKPRFGCMHGSVLYYDHEYKVTLDALDSVGRDDA